MHSSFLVGNDFEIKIGNAEITHEDFFKHFALADRVCLLSPGRVEGVAAANLILGYMTAFYNHYRNRGEEFHVYPEFYTIQMKEPPADYSMLDIYPSDKNLIVGEGKTGIIDILRTKSINILLLPENYADQLKDVLELNSHQIKRVYVYQAGNLSADYNISIKTNNQEIIKWTRSIFESEHLQNVAEIKKKYFEWSASLLNKNLLCQNYKLIYSR